ncbi:hypothetical protein DSL72_004492 [Monilinia vaccinii-corymbosi]|uniref:Uncharacterized protein n=1 Tax=Monilinia vaccinii-corymbosi TaxID=61207 RepID=A0A8A3P2C2_9HELO|nr:hypothetical protein DSL72_004492 [Monilinia vaccinii-corymbosi]
MAPVLRLLSRFPDHSITPSFSASSSSRNNYYFSRPISSNLQPRNIQPSPPPPPPKWAHLLRLASRQFTSDSPGIIPTTYGNHNGSPSPGVIVALVLGAVAGLLVLLWLLYTCCMLGRAAPRASYVEDVTVRERVRRGSRTSRRGSRRQHGRRVSVTEKVEVRGSRGRSASARGSPMPGRVVREEVRREARRPSPARVVNEEVRREVRRPSPAPVPERVIVEERREVRRSREERSPSSSGGGSEEIVVVEEHEPPRRTKSKRERRERERERNSGYRTVDPLSFGGVVGGVGEGRRGERRR